MGIKQIITDDLTGEQVAEDVKPTDVRVNGEDYSVYLGPESMETFIAFLKGEAPLLQVQQRPAARRSAPARGKSNAAEIRAWAKDQGLQVPDRGRIPQEVMDAWNAK
jgi:predicted xylose isomerase-like sugar epimerase